MSLFQRGRSRQDEARHRREVKVTAYFDLLFYKIRFSSCRIILKDKIRGTVGSHHVVMSLFHQVILSLCHHEAQEGSAIK